MSRAEPALAFELMISVIAPLRRPPLVARSRKGMLICPPARVGGCSKRSAKRLRRSIICRLAAIPKNGTSRYYVQMNIYVLEHRLRAASGYRRQRVENPLGAQARGPCSKLAVRGQRPVKSPL